MAYKTKSVQVTFNGGEIAPTAYGRIDIARWSSSLAQCWNFIPMPEGGVTRRTGTRFVAPVKEINARLLTEEGDYLLAEDGSYLVDEDDNSISTRPVLLFPFVFNDVQAYVLEVGDFYIRFFMNDGQLYGDEASLNLVTETGDSLVTEAGDYLLAEDLDPDAQPYEIASPWPATSVRKIQQAQTLDVMYMACDDFQQRVLSRLGHTDWTLSLFNGRNGPWRPQNDTAVTVQPSVVTGAGTLTAAGADLFDPGHVGALWRVEDVDQGSYATWEPGKAIGSTDFQVWYDGNVYESLNTGTTGAVAPRHLEGDRSDGIGGIEWRYLHSGFGVAKITGYVSPTVVNITVQSRLPSTGATTKWREGAWSDYRGWAAAVALFEQRLFWARDRTVWASADGDFEEYGIGTLPDDAITFTINAKTANPIQAIAEGPVFVALTRSREWAFPTADGESMNAELNFKARSFTSEGAAAAPAALIDGMLVFVGRTGRRLMGLVYDPMNETFATRELSVLSRHMLRPGG